jgi:hypothetical protein
VADGRDPAHGGCTCGGAVPAGRRDGFCSSWCRGRDEQGLPPESPPRLFGSPPPAGVTVADAEQQAVPEPGPAPVDDEPKRPAYRQRRRKIADEVEDRLRLAGMLDTYQAAQVLDLADALDWQGGSLSARATAHRELERQMSELLRGQGDPGSAVSGYRDEVAARRQARAERRAAGGGA